MAKKQKDKQPQKVEQAETPEETSTSDDASVAPEEALACTDESPDSVPPDGEASGEGDEPANPYRAIPEGEETAEGEEGEEEGAAGQLGTERYVLAGFFATGMLATYVLGKTLSGVWATLANKEWFAQVLPSIAAVPDDSKGTYSTLLAAVISIVAVYRTYKRPDVRAWSDEVAGELAKVKWPSKKEVSSSTTIVIIASLLATAYLTILDRLYAFVTNIVYGNGS